MQVSGNAGLPPSILLQRLFGVSPFNPNSSSASSTAAQNLPGDPSTTTANASSGSQAQLADNVLTALVNFQSAQPAAAPTSAPASGAPAATSNPTDPAATLLQSLGVAPPSAPPSPSDVASGLIKSFDANGDGQLSLQEVQQALANTGASSNSIAQAFTAIDANGDGQVSQAELTSAISSREQAQQAHHGGHRHHAAQAAAADLISSIGGNSATGLSLNQVETALGATSDAQKSSVQTSFAKLDANGDGQISSQELASAIQAAMKQAAQSYGQAAAMMPSA